MNNSNQKNFEYLPSVQQVLETLADDTASIKQTYLTVLIREELKTLRGRIRSTRFAPKSRQQALTIIKNNVQARIREMISTPIKRVINATGVVLHTGLGRAPLGERPLQYLMNIASGYLNLEFDLKNGKRGERLDLTDPYLRLLTGMGSSAIVNNNAAAVMISLNSFANRKEVIVSRGELIEIGGSFRLPDVMKKSGAKMVEVGTTNRTHLGDYENAINPKTGAILIAHTSNYRVEGFTTKPPEPDIVELAHKHNIPVIMDLGSGALIPTGEMGLPEEPPISAAVDTDFDVITFSGDKLLGGPQAGLIVGKSSYIKKIRKNPLMRVMRCDKTILSLLTYTLSKYVLNQKIPEVTSYSFLTRSRDQLRSMAQQVVQKIQNQVNDCLTIEICDTSTEAGSGSMPTELIPSVAIRIGTNRISEEKLSRLFRQQDPPVVGYLKDRQFYLDLMAVAEKELIFIQNAIVRVAAEIKSF
jgi:L-seryl-tRNA(Ser) seleniumtransferase